jgi:hypothetical protein
MLLQPSPNCALVNFCTKCLHCLHLFISKSLPPNLSVCLRMSALCQHRLVHHPGCVMGALCNILTIMIDVTIALLWLRNMIACTCRNELS